MPGYRLHIAGGLITFLITVFLLSYFFPADSYSFVRYVQWAGFTVLGSLFPDVDTKSKGQSIFYKVMFVLLLFFLLTKQILLFIFLSFFSLLPVLVRHRGLFHRAWFLIIISFSLAFLLGYSFPGYQTVFLSNAFFFVIGAGSHLALDKIPYLSK